jgi:hypothetical protein
MQLGFLCATSVFSVSSVVKIGCPESPLLAI